MAEGPDQLPDVRGLALLHRQPHQSTSAGTTSPRTSTRGRRRRPGPGKWKDRILGGNDEARVKLHAVFMSSGNNVSFSRELTRCLVTIELVPVSTILRSERIQARPDPRLGRRQPRRTDLIAWLSAGTGSPGNALATRARPFFFSSYESYARTMGGIPGRRSYRLREPTEGRGYQGSRVQPMVRVRRRGE